MLSSTFSLRVQVALFFGALTALLAGGLSLLAAQRVAERAMEDQGTTLQTLAAGTATMLAQGLYERQREIELLAEGAQEQQRQSAQEWRSLLDQLQLRRNHYAWIGFSDPQGRVRAASGGLLEGQDVSARPWFRHGREQAFVGDLHPAKLLAPYLPESPRGEPLRLLDFSAPVQRGNGELQGVLGLHLRWEWADEVVASLHREELRAKGVQLFVLSRRGEVLYRPPLAATELQPPATLPRGRPQVLLWSDGQRYLSAHAPVPARSLASDLGWSVVALQPLAHASEGAQRLWRQFLFGGAMVSLLGMALAWGLAGRFSRPLQRIAEVARRIEGGERQLSLPADNHSRELHQLSAALRGMQTALLEREAHLEQRVSERTAELEHAHAELSQANAVLSAMALNDALTGLSNRRAADARLEMEFQRHRRSGQALALALIDIDRFKSVNDRFGHAGGDQVLQRVAQVLLATVRRTDFLARFGGEEFLVLMPETRSEGALQLAERLRQAVQDSEGPPVRVTLSLGLCCNAERRTGIEAALQAADEALYAAKHGGRNRVERAPD